MVIMRQTKVSYANVLSKKMERRLLLISSNTIYYKHGDDVFEGATLIIR